MYYENSNETVGVYWVTAPGVGGVDGADRYWVINTIIYGLNTELLSLKLAAHIEKIEANAQLLEDSGTIGIVTYVQQAQNDILHQFQTESAAQMTEEGYYVIAAKTQQMLFQSANIQGKETTDRLLSSEITQEMVSQTKGTRTYVHEGGRLFHGLSVF